MHCISFHQIKIIKVFKIGCSILIHKQFSCKFVTITLMRNESRDCMNEICPWSFPDKRTLT